MHLGQADYTTCRLTGTLYVHKGFGFQVWGFRGSRGEPDTTTKLLRPSRGILGPETTAKPDACGLRPETLRSEHFLFQNADVGEVAVDAGEVQAVADDELVRDLEAQVLDVEVDLAPGGFG
jgi:hypothetical protein